MAWKMRMKCNREKSSSLPWDTAVAILAINDWGKFIQEQDTRSLVKRGLEWLIINQKKDGGWGGLLGSDSESPSNAIETGAALWIFCLASPQDFEKREVTKNGLEFLTRLQHRHGGYALQPGLRADTKSTAISTALNHCYEKNLERIPSSVSWLLENQTSEGNWTWSRDRYGQINATFYAIEALRIHYLQWEDSKVLEPIERAVNWYEAAAHLVVEEEKVGWAWEGAENTAAAVIALLDSGEPDSSSIIERGIEWLIAQHDPRDFWGYETPLVLLALIRYLEPKSRIESVIKEHTTGIRA
jgi:squalene cyclase